MGITQARGNPGGKEITMEEIKLKPCPFCGGTAGAIGDGAFDEDNCFWVRCWECGAETSAYESVEEAKEAWNRRADNG